MNIFKKIKWRRGMEITPITFEAQDQYHDSMVEATRKLVVAHGYGLVPGAELNVTTTIVDGIMSLQVLSLEAVSKSGMLMQIAGDSMSRKQPHAKGRVCFIVVHPDGEVEQEVNQVLYSKPRYAYDYCTEDEMDDDSFPIAKLVQESDVWKVQEQYIPPCMTIGAHSELHHMQSFAHQLVQEIDEIIKDRYKTVDSSLLSMLMIDWNGLDSMDTPKQFYLLLRKTVWFLSTMSISEVTMPKIPEIPTFKDIDILESVDVLVRGLSDFKHALSVKEPEKPKQEVKEEIIYDVIIP